MARTQAAADLSRRHRRAQLAVRAEVLAELRPVWDAVVDVTNLEGSLRRFSAAAVLIIRRHHRDSVGLALAYFRRFRDLEGVEGAAVPRRAAGLAPDGISSAIANAAAAGVVNARRRGMSVQAASRNGLVKALGAATQMTLSGARATITRSVQADERAQGWQRVTSGSPCSFCAVIASRGPVYTERSGRFEAHDHCSCTPEPVYEGSRPSAIQERLREIWDRVTEGLAGNDALNAFRRELEGRAEQSFRPGTGR